MLLPAAALRSPMIAPSCSSIARLRRAIQRRGMGTVQMSLYVLTQQLSHCLAGVRQGQRT
jgi:hypothetical protein